MSSCYQFIESCIFKCVLTVNKKQNDPLKGVTLSHMKLYSFLTGPDDEAFCKRVSEKLNNGWQLYGSPSLTFNGKTVIAGQAVVKEVEGEYHQTINLKSM